MTCAPACAGATFVIRYAPSTPVIPAQAGTQCTSQQEFAIRGTVPAQKASSRGASHDILVTRICATILGYLRGSRGPTLESR